jgi:hypothetical protein
LANPFPPDVAALIMACLAKDPAQRPQSARAVAEWIGLETVRKPSVQSLGEAMFPQPEAIPESPPEEPTVVAAPPSVGRGKLENIISGAVALLLLAGVAGIWYSVKHPAKDNETTPRPNTAESVSGEKSQSQKPFQTKKIAGITTLVTSLQSADGPAAGASFELAKRSSAAFNGDLPDTIWFVNDSAGDRYCLQFLVNGVLNYEAGRGVRANGKWESSGSTVRLDINSGYVNFSGKISGSKMTGEAHSKNGQTWTWEATPKD